ncbi:2'-5' RNA ligase family protein [Pseudonocardia sp. C8]|uniref:2'-5' RNA ligase family protein n=1 Tax=Pseudonocardia sp. C8 TaxID=2762759 RepID=UPI001642C60F|nr:2'-5' RNA ligase family protein [Pseudonocardia sp. C8]MBC3194161.1 2'-5' RNA ligase family protein [Pseudonocardia sp. C8]
MPTDAPTLRDHWWPRPGWHPGRLVYTWHLTFDDAPELHRLAAAYQRQLATLPGLNLVPLEWLHLTVQGVGYTDEIDDDALRAVVTSVQKRLAGVPAFDARFSQPTIFAEAIVLTPEPSEPFHAIQTAIRDGIADALGADAVNTGPAQSAQFRPHVSLAYSAAEHASEPYRAALDAIEPAPASTRIARATLITQNRVLAPEWVYRWTTEADAPLR